MNKVAIVMLTASALALASVSALASSSDEKKIEEECRAAAMEEEVAKEDMAGYIADCVAETLAAEETEESEDKE